MKPMPQITAALRSRRHDQRVDRCTPGRPLTDRNFQSWGRTHSSDENSRGRVSSPAESPSFRDISREFLSVETPRSFFAELFLFGVIVLISVWPLFSLLEAWAALPG
jgi:hypothetical protein